MDNKYNNKKSTKLPNKEDIMKKKTKIKYESPTNENPPPPVYIQNSVNKKNTNSTKSNIVNNQLYVPAKIPNPEQMEEDQVPAIAIKNNIDYNIQEELNKIDDNDKCRCCCCYCGKCGECECNDESCNDGCEECCSEFFQCCSGLF